MDWNTFYTNNSMPDYSRLLSNPDKWQLLLADYIRENVCNGELLEAGCGYGQTSLLVGENTHRTLMDIEKLAIDAAQKLFSLANQSATFRIGDINKMPFPDDTFDLVFNSGVLEHFDFCGRRMALLEMVRVTKPGGKICVAVPNHYSIPYRFSYEYRKANGTWPFPDEEMIFDFSSELADVTNVVQISRETIDRKTIFYYLSKRQKIWFKLLHMLKNYEGYLSIIMMEKKETELLLAVPE